MTKLRTAFSYSFLNGMKICPLQTKKVNIDKTYPFVESGEMKKGKLQHQQLEEAMSLGQPLPDELAHMAPMVGKLRAGKHLIDTELRFAVNGDWEPCGYFANDVFYRGQADLLLLNIEKGAGLVVDWKTGNPKYCDMTQLGDMAALTFAHNPEMIQLTGMFGWTRKDHLPTMKYYNRRDDYPNLKASIAARVLEFKKYEKLDRFPPRPGFACKNCSVAECSHYQGG